MSSNRSHVLYIARVAVKLPTGPSGHSFNSRLEEKSPLKMGWKMREVCFHVVCGSVKLFEDTYYLPLRADV